MVAATVKRDFRVLFQMEAHDKPTTCSIRAVDLRELHRLLVLMTQYALPIQDWYDLIVHETTPDSATNEYGKIYLGLMYDHMYDFKHEQAPVLEQAAFKIKGLTRSSFTITTGPSKSVCMAPWMTIASMPTNEVSYVH